MQNMNSSSSMSHTYFVIMAGGVGSRFWPASRETQPKQFLDILGTGRSLIQMTFDRISPLVPAEQILVLTHYGYKEMILEHLPEIPERNVLVEPTRQNTGPAIAYVAFHLRARDPEASLVILPADHLITREAIFQETLSLAADYVRYNPEILTLGMIPHRPDTGYGYIQIGEETKTNSIFHVDGFTEKPSLETAKKYLATEKYVWNAGIFISTVSTMLAAFEAHAPEIYEVLNVYQIYGGPFESQFIQDHYPDNPSISIDYAIMEKANNIVCFVVDIGWSDIGTWRSLYELRREEKGAIVTNVPAENQYITNSSELMIHTSGKRKVVIRGLKKMLVLDQEDILMIWPLDEEQEIKNARNRLGPQWDME